MLRWVHRGLAASRTLEPDKAQLRALTSNRNTGSGAGTRFFRKFFLKAMTAIASGAGRLDEWPSPCPLESIMPQEPPEKMMFQLNLRRRGISDQTILRAMEEGPREG